jgi:hypothetical protein
MRRRRDRLLKRKSRMMATLLRHGFFPQDEAARRTLVNTDPFELLWFYASVNYQYIAVKDASINHCVALDAKEIGGDFVANKVTVNVEQFFGLLG